MSIIQKSNSSIMFLFFLLALLGPVRAEEALRDKEVWDMEDVKMFLELPYEKHFDTAARPIDFSALDTLRGFSGFAIIPSEHPYNECQMKRFTEGRITGWVPSESISAIIQQEYDSEKVKDRVVSGGGVLLGVRPSAKGVRFDETIGAVFRVCSSDLSVFEVSIQRPESCEAACDTILTMSMLGFSSLKIGPDSHVPSFDDIGNTYRLVYEGSLLQLWYLDVKQGILIHVVYSAHEQPLCAPINRDVLTKQMNAVAEGLIEFFNSEPGQIDQNEEYYKAFVAALPDAPKREEVEGIPAGATRFDLLLSEIPPLEQEGSDLSLDMKKPYKLISTSPIYSPEPMETLSQ